MKILSLLSYIIEDNIIEETEASPIVNNNDTAQCIIVDLQLIDNYIIPLCEIADSKFKVVENHNVAILTFGKNPYNQNGELQSITIENSTGDKTTCHVCKFLSQKLNELYLIDIYYSMCNTIGMF